MLKLANQVIDAYDDVTMQGLRKLARKNPDVHVMSHDERSALHDTDFALSVITKKASKLNKFPINTHDNTWLSNEYFGLSAHKLPGEAAGVAAVHIKSACEEFDIEPTAAVAHYASMAKTASSNIYYEGDSLKPSARTVQPNLEKIAAVEDVGNNYSMAQYAFATPAHVKVACDYFEKNAAKMPLEVRHKYAAAIQRRSHELGMGVQKGSVLKYASDHYSPMVDAHVRSRASLLEVADPSLRASLDKLATLKTQVTPGQFAQLLHGFDKKAGLDRHYGGYLCDPYLATFAGEPDPYAGWRFKTASSRELTSDEVKSVIDSKYDKVKEHFGPHFAAEMKKDPVAIFDSLPNDAKELVAGMIDGTT